MPRKSPRKSQSSKVKIAASGDVTVGGDVVGRDKIIQNIVLVGQFLDFTKVEGLIPSPLVPLDFESVSAAFDATFSEGVGANLTQATAFAGEVLRDVITPWTSNEPFSVFPFRSIIPTIPNLVVNKLKQFGHWETFCSREKSYTTYCSVMWLHSHQILTRKYFDDDTLLGIAEFDELKFHDNSKASFVRKSSYGDIGISSGPTTSERFRVLMAGLVVDLMRLASTAQDDIKFWNKLVGLLVSD